MSCEGSDDDKELKAVPVVNNNNNNVNVVTDFNSHNDIKHDNKNLFDEDIDDEVEAAPHTTIKGIVVHEMKKLQASYNNHSNKIVKQATKEKSAIENLNFLHGD